MSKLTKRYQILVVVIFLFLETVLEGVAEPPDPVSEKGYSEEELHHQVIRTKSIQTHRNESFERNDNNIFTKIKLFIRKHVILSKSKCSKALNSKFKLRGSDHFIRNIRSIKSTNVSITQFEQLCGRGLEIQLPCTCYHPDHPNVTRIELDIDENTKNQSSLNDKEPASCEDLLSIGYKVPGFYLVKPLETRLKPKRVKAIYCSFSQTFRNLSSEAEASKIFLRNRDRKASNMIQFCNSLGSQPCKFLYSDYPDVPPFHPKKNKTARNNTISSDNYDLEPTNCIDLKIMGHSLRGFYVVRFNALKVKIIFCDFNQIIETPVKIKTKQFALEENGTASSKNITRVCEGIGSQPCSCYYSNFPEVIQFQFSNDDITREAIHKNGNGPSTCEELKQVGHNLSGFYFLRTNTTKIKAAYCTLNEIEQRTENNDKNESRTGIQLKLAFRETRTETSSKNEKKEQNCEPNNNIMNTLKKGDDNNSCVNATNKSISSLKYESRPQVCGDFGAQPCTCHYPDHPNVTLFELDTDEITINATRLNGTGPTSCEDLQSIGHSLKGFYLVRFKPNRVKTIYCGFNQTRTSLSNKSQLVTKSSLKQIRDPSGSSEVIRFCNGLGNQPCTFLYPDHPDVPLLHLKRNKTVNINSPCENCVLGPTSCDDLRLIGHKLRGFYIIRQNALKVKIIYCDFDHMISNVDKLMRTKRFTLEKNVTKSSRSNVTRVCRDVGSQPCSCYYSNNRDILQFEMSNDEITRGVMNKNGIGPATCEELKKIGHTFNGFYMLRFNTATIKTVYCDLKELKRKKKKKIEKNELSIIEPTSTLLEIKTSTPTLVIKNKKKEKHQIITREPTGTTQDLGTSTPIVSATTKKNRPKCKPSYKVYHMKNENQQGVCLEITTQKSLSLSECDNFPLEQRWNYIRMLPSPWFSICIASGTSCITVIPPPWFSGRKPEVNIKEFEDSGQSLHQQWILDDKTRQLKNIATKLCLAVYSKTVENPSSTGETWKFEMNHCLAKPNKTQKWSFVRVLDNNNVPLCSHGGLD